MRSKLATVLCVIGAVTVLVLAANTVAIAATGRGFLLGKTNKANAVTTLQRTTPGAALQLKTKSSSAAPITTNGTGKVANLNADRIDGLDSTALKTAATGWKINIPQASETQAFVAEVPLSTGSWILSYSAYLVGSWNDGYATCYFSQENTDITIASDYFGENRVATVAGNVPALSGIGHFTKTNANRVLLHCNGSVKFHTFGSQQIQVTALRVDSLSRGTLNPFAKKPARSSK